MPYKCPLAEKACRERNKAINRERRLERYKNDPSNYQINNLKARYNVTKEVATALYMRSQGSCDCCGDAWGGEGAKHHVDHCHTTGGVRGVLCYSCNKALGHARESTERLRAIADYIERTSYV